MQKKGYAGIILLVILVALAMTIGYWSRVRVKKELLNLVPAPTETLEPSISVKPAVESPAAVPTVTESPAASVVRRFCENFFSGPPAVNDAGVIQALSFLSSKAIDSISTTGPGPSATIIAFTGVSDIPSGFTIDAISEGNDAATVKTTWIYLPKAVEKTFSLVKENGTWKIDAIQ